MNQRILLRSLAYLLVIGNFISCSTSDNSTAPPQEPSMQERLQEIIDSKMGGDDKLKGVTVSIRQGTTERWLLSGGISDETTPMQTQMKFGIASITKTVVAATVLKLEEEGLLSLDDTIGDWLTLNNPNIDHNITVYQLLIHLSGLNGYMVSELWNLVEADFSTPIPLLSLTDYVLPPYNNPGVEYTYSNANYLILGLIIKEASGQTVGEVMRTRFWNTIGLNNTFFGTDETIPSPIAASWRDSNDDGVLEDISSQYGPAYHSVFFCAADVFTTASDLSLWAQLLYDGNALTEASRNKMLTFLDIDSGTPYWSGYGLGVRRFHFHGREMWGHTGGMRGYGTYMLYEPVSGMSIVMLNNQSRSLNGPLLRFELVNEILLEVLNEI